MEIWALIKDHLEPALSLISFVFIMWLWLTSEFGRKWRYKKWLKEAKNSSGCEDAVLIIDVNPNTAIKSTVTRFLKSQALLKDITDEKIIQIELENITEAKLLEFRKQLKTKIIEIQHMGVRQIHLFYTGPVVVAAIIGAELGNGIPTHIYHFDKTSKNNYCDWGPLKVPVM